MRSSPAVPEPTVMTHVEKSGMPRMPSSGVMMSATSEVTMAPNAAPSTTATARSMMLPRNRKSRNSPIISHHLPVRPDPLAVGSRRTIRAAGTADDGRARPSRDRVIGASRRARQHRADACDRPAAGRPPDRSRSSAVGGPGPARRRPVPAASPAPSRHRHPHRPPTARGSASRGWSPPRRATHGPAAREDATWTVDADGERRLPLRRSRRHSGPSTTSGASTSRPTPGRGSRPGRGPDARFGHSAAWVDGRGPRRLRWPARRRTSSTTSGPTTQRADRWRQLPRRGAGAGRALRDLRGRRSATVAS